MRGTKERVSVMEGEATHKTARDELRIEFSLGSLLDGGGKRRLGWCFRVRRRIDYDGVEGERECDGRWVRTLGCEGSDDKTIG